MALTTTSNRVVATGDNSTTVFAFNRLLYDATHLKVYLDGVLQPSGYTVSGVPGTSITVTFSVAPGTGVQVLLLRVVPLTQLSVYAVGGAFPAATTEKNLDLLMMGNQQFDEILGRAVTLPVESTLTAANLPDPSLAANFGKGIKIKGDGTGLDTFTINAGDIAGILTTKGDMLVYSSAVDRLPVGLNHLILTARSSAGAGVAWRDQINAGAVKFEEATDPSKTLQLILGAVSASTTRKAFINDEDVSLAQLWDVNNLTLTATVAASALTIAVKTKAGTDPSSTNPILFKFRNATAGTGDYTTIALTAALSLVISSGSTLGTVSGAAHRLYIGVANDGGTLRLFIYNPTQSNRLIALPEGQVYSSTAEGGVGGADSAFTLYSGTAFTAKAVRVIGYIESTQATAGTWATTPSRIHILKIGDKRSGDIVQVKQNRTGTVATGTTTFPNDDTVPQDSEGNQFMTEAITPSSAINLLEITHIGFYATSNADGGLSAALFKSGTSSALASARGGRNAGAGSACCVPFNHIEAAGATSTLTFNIRAGTDSAGTTTFNGTGGAQLYAGTFASILQIKEIFV